MNLNIKNIIKDILSTNLYKNYFLNVLPLIPFHTISYSTTLSIIRLATTLLTLQATLENGMMFSPKSFKQDFQNFLFATSRFKNIRPFILNVNIQ